MLEVSSYLLHELQNADITMKLLNQKRKISSTRSIGNTQTTRNFSIKWHKGLIKILTFSPSILKIGPHDQYQTFRYQNSLKF